MTSSLVEAGVQSQWGVDDDDAHAAAAAAVPAVWAAPDEYVAGTCASSSTQSTSPSANTRNAYHHYRKFYTTKNPLFCSYESLWLPLCSRPAGCTRDAASIVAARCRSLLWNRHVQKSALMNACDVPISLPPSILQYSVTERRYHCANHDSRQRYQCLMIPGGLCV